jgi:hypothetical protein
MTMEASLAETLTVIRGIGATQSVLGDALREWSSRMSLAETLAQESNRRLGALEESIAEIKDLLARALGH